MVQENKTKKSIVRSGISLSVLTLISRVLGLLREMTKAAFLGTSVLGDAFTFAFQLPNLFRRLFAENSVSVAFIPTFRQYLEAEQGDELKRQETREFVNATFTLVTFLTTVFTVIAMLAAPLYIPFFSEGSDAAVLSETTLLTRIMFPYLIVISVAAFFQGILNGIRIFAPSGFTPILFNLTVIITTYVLAPHMENPARAMATGTILGGSIQALFQLPFVLKNGWKVSFTGLKKTFTNPGTRKVMALVLPTIIGMAAYQVNDLVSMHFAAKAGTGVQSSLSYSLRLQELILGIFAVSVSTVILPDLTDHAANKNREQFNSLLISAIRIIIFISIPVTVFSLITGENMIRLLFMTRSFNEQSVALTLSAFQWHITGLVFIALNRILAPSFYAQSNSTLPAAAGIINFCVNIVLAAVLSGPMKGAGIALALSAASVINTVMLFVFMKKMPLNDVGRLIRESLLYLLRMTVFSLIAGAALWFAKPYIFGLLAGHNRLIAEGIPLILSVMLFGAIGVLLMVVTKDPLLKEGRNLLRKKTGRK